MAAPIGFARLSGRLHPLCRSVRCSLMSVWFWLAVAVVVVLVVPVAMRFAETEPQNGTGEDLAARGDEDPDGMLARAA